MSSPCLENLAMLEPVVRSVIVSQEDMMRYHDPERIQHYCHACEKYGKFWSCPPFENQPLASLPPWTHAVLMTQKTPVRGGSSPAELIEQFMLARALLSESMLRREAEGTVTVIAGHCAGCVTCTRSREKPCGFPSKMQYSLEALGFDVTRLAEELAGQPIEWPEDGKPAHLMIVGALLCASHDLARRISA